MNASPLTAMQAALLSCHVCALITQKPKQMDAAMVICPRCREPLHERKPDSIARTWALVIAAIILYIPANIFPIMTVIRFGRGEPDTILSGVMHLIEGGMWPLALLVFVASIVVPILKLGILIFLLISIHLQSTWRPKDRTVLYRIIEAVGHWSMVDVFLISILVALVNLDMVATIRPGIGATFFAAVVVLTIFAAKSFDPRLIWDCLENQDECNGRNPTT